MKRRMGFTEQFAARAVTEMNNNFSLALVVNVNGKINFDHFKQALHILFLRQPMLRAILQIKNGQYFFNFSADFKDILINYVMIDHEAQLENIYKRDIFKPYDLNHFFWRAILTYNAKTDQSSLVVGVSHAIADGISLNWLMGDLLRIIIELEQGGEPSTDSLPMMPLVDDVLDYSRFVLPEKEESYEFFPFSADASRENAAVENFYFSLNSAQLEKLLNACKQHKVTITYALIAAFLLSYQHCYQDDIDDLFLIIPFNLKPYLTESFDARLLACYSEGLGCQFSLKNHGDFWSLAQHAKQVVAKSIQEFQLPPYDQQDMLKTAMMIWNDNIKKSKFTMPFCVSQFGNLEAAYAGIESYYSIESIISLQSQCAMGMPLAIHAMTAQKQFYISFNFAVPAMDAKLVQCMADKLLDHLISL